MNTTYYRLEIARIFRDWVGLIFTVGIPLFMYLIFGAAAEYKDDTAGNGNVAAYLMVSMAAYGAVTATTGIGGYAAIERAFGWGRQLGLTPMRDGTYVGVKTATAITICLQPLVLIYLIGWLTGARADWQVWVLAPIITMVGAAAFAIYGMVFGLWMRSESAGGAAGGSLVILAFLGNIFMPLSGTLLTIAKFTPLYGLIQLVRYPLTEGRIMTPDGLIDEPLWVPLANVAAWLLILSMLATWLVRRSRGRQ
ncbi:ABC transporter permease [Arsenicicoccus bolidensis]|uniref:ABC transporter permease n=1 Tax=Arsenicicoccus bolidensis TaxID=229480 RepID=A0ABS9PZ14_9MICO|nr:ABC transporter permease [Arsenicicoccus bolidensis]MCG7320769.1 ABC transporter permease [Arsenicicoccus bolidensis]